MNIILQNYNNLINKLVKDYFSNKIERIISEFNNYSINNYINLISSLDDNMNSFMCNSLKYILEEIDRCYCNSLERKRKYHIKFKTKRTILTVFGEITYNRTFFKSKLNGSCFCYVDRMLGIPKYDYFDPYIKAEILSFVSNNNYSDTANHINSLIGNRISVNEKNKLMNRQTVRNVILKAKLSKPDIKRLPNVSELFIMADEKWIPTQNNKKKKVMQKSIVIFDGFIKKGKRKSLNHKMTFSGRNEEFIFEAMDYIEKAYDLNYIKTFYMLGDGANWIDSLKYYFNENKNIEIIQGLDHFHFKQCIWKLYSNKEVYNELIKYIKNDNIEDFQRLVNEIIDLNIDRKEKIEEYKNYILKHWFNIMNIFKYELSCPMESQISHTFASYFTSRPKGYSKKTINKLIKLRLLNKNGYNIKELYLNNLNKEKIITINEATINYSIFDSKETMSIPINKLERKLSI